MMSKDGLSPKARAFFEAEKKQAWDAFVIAIDPAKLAYNAALEAAREADDGSRSSRRAHWEAIEDALEARDLAMQPASRAYEAAIVSARKRALAIDGEL